MATPRELYKRFLDSKVDALVNKPAGDAVSERELREFLYLTDAERIALFKEYESNRSDVIEQNRLEMINDNSQRLNELDSNLAESRAASNAPSTLLLKEP